MSRLRNEEIQKFLDGDDSVFPEIFGNCQNKLYYLAINILHNDADSEEAIQNTFIEVITNRKTLREVKAFNVWLYRIAYHNILDIYRKNKRSLLTKDGTFIIENYSDKKGDLEDIVRKKTIFEEVQKEIDKLPEDMREVCLLRFISECSIEEIADIMDVPIGTIKSRLHRAKKQLKTGLSNRQVTPSVYLSFTFTPLMYRIYNSLVMLKTLDPDARAKVGRVIENTTGVSVGVGVGRTGAFTGVGTSVISAGVLLGAFGTYTFLNPEVEVVSKPIAHLKEVVYLEELTNEDLQVVLSFDEKPDIKDIKVVAKDTNEEMMLSSEDGYNYAVIVNRNGIYTLQYQDIFHEIVIENIDKEPPIMSQLIKEEGLLKIVVSDDMSGINFEESYIQEESKKFGLIQIGAGTAYLKDAIEVEATLYLYDNTGNYQVYKISSKEIEQISGDITNEE